MPETEGPKRPNRTMVEVTPDTRRRLRRVAVERDVTMKDLLDELSRRAEQETFGSVRGPRSADATPPDDAAA